MDHELHEMVEYARAQLQDEAWVAWALSDAGDLNEGALVTAYEAIVKLADLLNIAGSDEK